MANKILKIDSSLGDAYVSLDLGSNQTEIWITTKLRIPLAANAVFTAATNSGNLIEVLDDTDGVWNYALTDGTVWYDGWGGPGSGPVDTGRFVLLEEHYDVATGTTELYVDTVLVAGASGNTFPDARSVNLGIRGGNADLDSVIYCDDFKVGTTRGANDLGSDDFESGDLSFWTSTTGGVSVIDDPPKWLRVNAALADAWVDIDLGIADLDDVYVTCDIYIPAAALAFWTSTDSGKIIQTRNSVNSEADFLFITAGRWSNNTAHAPLAVIDTDTWQTPMIRDQHATQFAFFLNTVFKFSGSPNSPRQVGRIRFGQYQINVPDDAAYIFIDNIKIGSTPGGSEYYSDDFESGDLSAWTSSFGDVVVVDNLDPPPATPHPPNDDFANAIELVDQSSNLQGDNTNGTLETDETGGGDYGNNSVWYKFTPLADGTITISTDDPASGSPITDSVLDLLTGSSVDALTSVDLNDDNGINTYSVLTDEPIVGGTTYYIRIRGFGIGTVGGFTLTWDSTVPFLTAGNDDIGVVRTVTRPGIIAAERFVHVSGSWGPFDDDDGIII